jgi:hypothetical protein
MLVLTAAVGTTLLTGCASMDRGYSQSGGAVSSLAFTTVTDPRELVKWSNDSFLQRSLRSVDTYYFEVPDTGYRPASDEAAVNEPSPTYRESAGAGPGRYQSESGSYRVIRYRPGALR